MSLRKFVVGCGYLGLRVARIWRDAGHTVYVTTRSDQRAGELMRQGFEPLVIEITAPNRLVSLPAVDTVLYAVGFDRRAGVSREDVYCTGVKNVLQRLPRVNDRLIYISSTGVYGQSMGEWVDEQSACQPTQEGGQVCLAAEELLQTSPFGGQSVILRLAGIYGPSRVPFLERLRNREAIPVVANGYLNLIHVEDAVAAVIAAESANLPNLYVVSDGHPVLRRRYYESIARRLDVEATFADPDRSTSRGQRGLSSKRVCNDRIVRDLQLTLQYPNYETGLDQILSSEAR